MRRFLFVLALCLAVTGAAFAQLGDYLVTPSFLASNGLYYGVDQGGLFSLSYSRGYIYTVVNSSVSGQICAEATDGTLLVLTSTTYGSPEEMQKVTLAGVATKFAALPAYAACPVPASDGNYYGYGAYGGAYGSDRTGGFLYQLTPAGGVTTFYNFTGKSDGEVPISLLQGADGNLYGVDSAGLFHYSSESGLAVSTASIRFPIIFQASDGNFYGTYYTEDSEGYYSIIEQVTPTGTVTGIYSSPVDSDGIDLSTIDAIYFGGDHQIYSLEYNPIPGVGDPSCGNSNYLTMIPVDLAGNASNPYFEYGSEANYTSSSSDDYYGTLYLAGNGSYFGAFTDDNETFTTLDGQPPCSGVAEYPIFTDENSLTPATPPIAMNLSATQVLPGARVTLDWQVNNASSGTMQQCYGYGGLNGKLALSGSETLTIPAAGTYPAAIICGGVETSVVTVNAGSAGLTLYTATPSVPIGVSVSLTATVTNVGTPAPTGTVKFYSGATLLGSASMTSSGTATFTASTAGLPAGTYSVIASYLGDTHYAAQKSSAISITLTPPAPTTASLYPAAQTVTEGVTSAVIDGGVVETGDPYVVVNGQVELLLGTTVLATQSLSDGGTTFTFSTAGITPGTYSVTGKYLGNDYYAPSTASAVQIIVNPPDSVAVTATPNPVPAAGSFTLTATAKGSSATPTGTVIFYGGTQDIASSSLNSSGVATVTLKSGTLAAGTYSVTAYYAGDSKNPAVTSPAISFTVE